MKVDDFTSEQWRRLVDAALEGRSNMSVEEPDAITDIVRKLQEHFQWNPPAIGQDWHKS